MTSLFLSPGFTATHPVIARSVGEWAHAAEPSVLAELDGFAQHS